MEIEVKPKYVIGQAAWDSLTLSQKALVLLIKECSNSVELDQFSDAEIKDLLTLRKLGVVYLCFSVRANYLREES